MSPPFLGCFRSDSFYTCRNEDMHKILDEFEFRQIGPLTTELAALERLKNPHRLIMGKWCRHASLFIFERIIIKVAGNQEKHKSLVEFDFGPNQTTHFGVTCP